MKTDADAVAIITWDVPGKSMKPSMSIEGLFGTGHASSTRYFKNDTIKGAVINLCKDGPLPR